MRNFQKTNTNNQILDKLVFETCLNFGRNPKINNSKIHHYILGIRQKINIFKFQEIRYLLLKIYPVIHHLFLQERLNFKQKKKWFFPKNYNFQTQSWIKPFRNSQGLKDLNQRYSSSLKKKTLKFLPPKILFATTTELYSEIVSAAAKKCYMPFHVKRWLSGSVTAASSYITDRKKWSFSNDLPQEKRMDSAFQKRFPKYKKNREQQKNRVKKYQLNRKFTLIIIPDVSNNDMILRETNSFGIPALGLVNSQNQTEVAYPIFVNEVSVFNVHFFCNFLSALILKEFVKTKQKIATALNKTKKGQFTANMNQLKNFLKKNQRNFSGKKNKRSQAVHKHIFQGNYFLENFLKPKDRIKKKFDFAKMQQQQIIKPVAPIDQEHLVDLENQNRLKKNQIHFRAKNNFLTKITKIQTRRTFNFPKITRAIRLPANKPKFRFWNKNAFYFTKTAPFLSNSARIYKLKRFRLNAILRKKIKAIKRKERELRREKEMDKWKAAQWKTKPNKSNPYRKSFSKNKYLPKQNRFHTFPKKNQLSSRSWET